MNNTQFNSSPLSANGRFGRLAYLGWNMLVFLVTILFAFVVGAIMAIVAPNLALSTTDGSLSIPLIIIFTIFYIALIYFSFIFAIRRLHDLNKTGWLSLLILIPLINFLFILYLIFAPGSDGINNYGHPHITKTWEKLLGIVYVLIFPFGIFAAIAIPAYQNYIERAQQHQIEQKINTSPSE